MIILGGKEDIYSYVYVKLLFFKGKSRCVYAYMYQKLNILSLKARSRRFSGKEVF